MCCPCTRRIKFTGGSYVHIPAGAPARAAADLSPEELAVARPPAAPSPHPPQKPARDEQLTAKAELHVVLFPKGPQGGTTVQVPGAQAGRLIRAFEHLVLAAIALAAVIGTLYGGAAAHLPPMGTVSLVAGELFLIAGAVIVTAGRRRKRR